MFSAKERLQLLNWFDVDNGRAMDAPEFFRIELCLHRAQGLPYHRREFARVEMHIFIVCFYPVNFVDAEKGDAPTRFDHKAIEVLRFIFDALQQRANLRTSFVFALGTKTL